MNDIVEQTVVRKLAASQYITILTDESTDITNKKRQVIYAQVLNKKYAPETIYICNIDCENATGLGIANAVLSEMSARGVTAERIMLFGSDGASAMTGKEKGAAAIIRQRNPHMHNVHCVAHKLALCTSQAGEKVPLLKKHQQVLTDLFYYFKGSGQREARLHAIQEVLDDPVLIVKEVHSVRWLSFFSALTAVWRTLDSLLTYLAESSHNDSKAAGLKKKVKLDECKDSLEKVRRGETSYLKMLPDDLRGGTFKGHHVTTTNFNLQNSTDTFIDNLLDNLQSRFPDDDILGNFAVLGMRPISFLNKADLQEYGEKEIESLCSFYGEPKTIQWKKEGEIKSATSPPVIDKEEAKSEWAMIKLTVLAEQYPRDKMSALWQLIHLYHQNDFPNILKLAALGLTSAVHTAGCERGFSVQNKILVKSRSRLNIETQHKLPVGALQSQHT